MGELTTDSTPGGSTPAAAPTAASVALDPRHYPIGCPECFEELQRNRDWWKVRPEGSRLVGLVVARRAAKRPGSLRRRDPRLRAPRSAGLGDVEAAVVRGVAGRRCVVVVNERAVGQTPDEVARTTPTLRRHNLVVKVLGNGAPHPQDARG